MNPSKGGENRGARDEESRWREAFFRNAEEMAFIFSMTEDGEPGPILEVNPAACRTLDYAREELLGKAFLDLLPREERDRIPSFPAEPPEEGSFAFRTRLITRKGGWIPAAGRGFRLGREGGVLLLPEEKGSSPREESLRREEADEKFLEDVFEAIQDGISVLDSDLTILRVNRWMERMYGFQGKLTGRKCHQVYHGRDSVCPWCPTVKALRTGKAHTEVVPYPYQEEEAEWLELTAYPVVDREGRVKGVIEHVRDITERKRAQRTRDMLLTALEQSGEILALTDRKGVIQYVNRAFEKVTGYSREEAVGRTFALVKSGDHDRAFYRDLWTTIESGRIWSGRIRNKRKDGTVYYEQAVISPILDPEGGIQGFAKAARDVTRELALQERLLQAQRMESVGTLAGGIAHDFNNLLLAIMGNLDLALLSDMQKCREHLEEAKKAASRAGELTRQLLAFSRRQILRSVDLDLNRLVEDLLVLLRRLLGKNIEVDFIPSHAPGTIHADPSQMEQVVMNLILNARDAMPRGGKIIIETENVVINGDFTRNHPWARQGRYLLLSVTDTGEGMPPEVLERIFEPFFSTKEVGKGTGLGLATVYGIVQQHGGMIHAYSEVGRGSTFKVYLPIVERPAATVGPKLQGPIPEGRETILLAEDEGSVRDLMTKVLESAGYLVLPVENGRKALEAFEERRGAVDLAVLDVVMPEMGGTDLARELRARKPGLPVLFISGYPSRSMDKELKIDSGVPLLCKPFDGETLLRKVREALQTRR